MQHQAWKLLKKAYEEMKVGDQVLSGKKAVSPFWLHQLEKQIEPGV